MRFFSKTKFFLLTGLFFLTLPLMSYSEASIVGECEAYCAGYADAKEEDGEIEGMEEWNATYNDCVENATFCKADEDGGTLN